MAKGFLALAIKKGDAVAVQIPNSPEWCMAFLALSKIGAVFVDVNAAYKKLELEFVLLDAAGIWLVTVPHSNYVNYLDNVNRILPNLANSTQGTFNNLEFPALQGVICLSKESYPGVVSLKDLLERGKEIAEGRLEEAKKIIAQDVCNMLYTSGTQGMPKGVATAHFSFYNNAVIFGEILEIKEDNTLCSALPLFHCFPFALFLVWACY